jgi:hypothetical protein
MKLISMTDFVMEQSKTKQSTSEFKESIVNYSNFLKQPLTLGMFLPCDLDGKILNLQKESDHFMYYNGKEFLPNEKEKYMKFYNEAKNRVLFEGFKQKIWKGKTYLHNDSFGSVYLEKNWVLPHCFVEDLIGIELTKSAIKKI